MPIEKDLKRIADALEALVSQGGQSIPEPVAVNKASTKTATETIAPPIAAATETIAPPVAEVVQPAFTAPIAPPVQTMLSAEEMNNMLVTEFKRIGSREPIDTAMTALGVTSVTDLSAVKQQELITAVRAIQS